MSRTLGRLRRLFGGSALCSRRTHLVPTARALELGGEVRAIAARAGGLFEPPQVTDPATAVRIFDLQISDAMSMPFTPALLEDLWDSVPGLTVQLHPESTEAVPALREALVDLEIGDISRHEREIQVQALAMDVFVAAVHRTHPLSTPPLVTPEQFAAAAHVTIS
ncbi:LysR substrate-binding domain-containing protein [Streptomyces sp. NPDC102364]|uniref:LysR substrate-binding domain-containing protein n=1 Tax=Streptomyces sp. NPDC102364 TaxID=3366161 RepID=UPI00381A91DA